MMIVNNDENDNNFVSKSNNGKENKIDEIFSFQHKLINTNIRDNVI